ncbi:hypothetical protein JCM16303_005765 [Sporobolomyces ruberrimus]
MSSSLEEEALPEHAYYCFEVINAQLNNSEPIEPEFDDSLEFPLFVTWNIKSRSDGDYRLRGCIGNFSAMPLREGLREYAATSAFGDSRFEPVSAKELKRLQCGVSLLTNFEECKDYLDWTLDVHGIYVQFPNPALSFPPSTSSSSTPSSASTPSTSSTEALNSTTSYRSLSSLPQLSLSLPRSSNPNRLKTVLHATFLPDVAGEQGWSKVDAVNAAIRKAGYKGSVTEELRKSCKVSRYQSKKVKVDYDEWIRWRKEQGY